mgnify:CR=1 FL=1
MNVAQNRSAAFTDKTYIPLEVLGKKGSRKNRRGEIAEFFNLWCSFYDTDTDKLYVAYGKSGRVSRSNDIKALLLSHCYTVKPDQPDNLELEQESRVLKKSHSGFESIPGSWYIDPQNTRLVNVVHFSDDQFHAFHTRGTRLNGFPDQQEVVRAIGNRPLQDGGLAERLSSVNPVAQTWFFSS